MRDQVAHLVVTDIRMPEIGGLELIERLHELEHPPVIIVISGYSEFDYARKARNTASWIISLKPLDKRKLVTAVESALERQEKLIGLSGWRNWWIPSRLDKATAFRCRKR